MSSDATGQVVLVTGASSGIGQATARRLADRGYRVFGTCRRPTERPADRFEMLPLEVTSNESATACVRDVLERTGGRIDVLVNNIGTGILGAAEESTAAEARDLFEVNFFGAVRMTNAVLPTMRAQRAGKVLAMSSTGGIAAVPFGAFYSATKFALEGYFSALRNELHPFNIGVVVIAPGPVSTPAGDVAARAAHPIPDYEPTRSRSAEQFIAAIKAGMDPARVAEAVLKIIESRSPAPRYPVGPAAHGIGLLRRLLPTRAFSALTRWATRPR